MDQQSSPGPKKSSRAEYRELVDESIDELNADSDFSGTALAHKPEAQSDTRLKLLESRWFAVLVVVALLNLFLYIYYQASQDEIGTAAVANQEAVARFSDHKAVVSALGEAARMTPMVPKDQFELFQSAVSDLGLERTLFPEWSEFRYADGAAVWSSEAPQPR